MKKSWNDPEADALIKLMDGFSPASRREFLQLCAIGTVALGLGGCGAMEGGKKAAVSSPGRFQGTRKVRVGILAPSHCSSPYTIAMLQNYYRDAGLEVDVANYSNMPDIAGDLIKGEIDAGQLITPLFIAISSSLGPFQGKGAPLITTMATGTNGGAITVKADSSIEYLEDLKGKRIASHSKLTTHYLLARYLMDTIGAEDESGSGMDLKIMKMNEMIPSLAAGEIDAFIMPEPLNAMAEAKGVGKVLVRSSSLWRDHPCCLTAFREDFSREHPDTVGLFTKVTASAALEANDPEKREKAIDILQSSEWYKKIPKAVMMKAFAPERADFYPFPYLSFGQAVANIMEQFGVVPAGSDLTGVIRRSWRSDLARTAMKAAGAPPPSADTRVEKIMGKIIAS